MKYYKILRSDMKHHGFVYKEGLNIDTEPFDETPDCGGGLFFSDAEHILSFVNYGNLIAEVEVPNGEKIIPVENKYKAHAIVLKNIRPLWNINTFEYLIQKGIDIHVDDDSAFVYAARNNDLELVKFLVCNKANIHSNNELALRLAACNGYLEIVRYLINNGANIHAANDWVLQLAASHGHLEIVKYLISKGADIHTDNDLALQLAASNGYLEVVRYLIENGANIHADDDWAFKYGTPEVLTYLNSISDK